MFRRLLLSQPLNRPLIRLFSTRSRFLQTLLPDTRCRSCGITLQLDSPDEPGYFRFGKTEEAPKPKYRSEADEKYNAILGNLDPEDRNLLINNFNAPTSSSSKTVQELSTSQPIIAEEEKEVEPHPQEQFEEPRNASRKDIQLSTVNPGDMLESTYTCIRCRDIQHRSKFNINSDDFVIEDLDNIVSNLPKDSPLVYIFGALDFPMGINPAIFKYRDPKDLYFIMTKTDNLYEHSNDNYLYTKQFLNDYLGRKYGIPGQNIFITSGKKRWKANQLYKFIPNYSYIIGYTNCGKSTLLKSLKINEEVKNWTPKNKKEFQEREKMIEKMFTKVGPGVSHIPGFTREITPVYINDGKVIYDVPGFESNKHIKEIYEKLDSKSIAHLFKGSLALKRAMYRSKYTSIKGPKVLSIEGVGFLQFPENTIYQIRNASDLQLHAFRDINKVASVVKKIPDALKKRFLLQDETPKLSKMNKFIIPPFYGTIDLVLENIGYLNIKPVGAKSSNELIKFYLHPSINSIIRQPVMNYINKTFTGVDKNGQSLHKRDWTQLSTFHLVRYTNEQPFYSKLVPANDAKDKNDYELVNEFAHNGREYNDEYKITEENKYDFWKE